MTEFRADGVKGSGTANRDSALLIATELPYKVNR